jgi:hypothetical protein
VVSADATLPVRVGRLTAVVLSAGGTVAVTLPAVTAAMDLDVIKGDTDAYDVTVTPSSGHTINGQASATLSAVGDALFLRFDGTATWHHRNPVRTIP